VIRGIPNVSPAAIELSRKSLRVIDFMSPLLLEKPREPS
jgi:hypothetical protein